MRPLLPRPGLNLPVVPPASKSDSPILPLAPKTLTACNECRHKKAKCNGARPSCSRCRRAGATCVYASDSIVAQNALKRRFKDLQDNSDTQIDLIRYLRTRDQHEALAVLQRLRAGETVEALVKFVKHGDLLLQCHLTTATQTRYDFPMGPAVPSCLGPSSANPFTRSLLYQKVFTDHPQLGSPASRLAPAYENKYDWPYHAAKLVEPSLDIVRASQWTTVTDSDDLVRSLLKAYFYYDFPCNPIFHKDTFIVDLVAGRKAYCSSLLVNAVLACACHCLRTPTSSTDFWNPKELIYQFTAEARRLWEREHLRNHITTVQAGAIIGYMLNYDGMDKIGFRYLQISVNMARDMGLFSDKLMVGDIKKQSAFAATAWGLFCMQTRQTFHIRQPPMLVQPPDALADESFRISHFCELFVLYPQASQPTRIHHSLVFNAMCKFFVILNNVTARTYGMGKILQPISFEEALEIRDELLQWRASLPNELQPAQVVFPAQLNLHMQYFLLLIFIFDRYTNTGYAGPDPTNRQGMTAQAIVASATTCLESVLYLYYARHSFEGCDTAILAYFDLIGFSTMKQLVNANSSDRTVLLSTLMLCAKGLCDQARHYYMAELVFAILRDSLSPADSLQLRQIANIENEEKRKRLMVEHVFSRYPLKMSNIYDEATNNRLDELMKGYELLDLDSIDSTDEVDDEDAADTYYINGDDYEEGNTPDDSPLEAWNHDIK